MEERINVDLATDQDGFVSQECPACERRFKVIPGEGSDRPISFCPYCQHEGRSCWWTPEQAEYLSAIVGEQVLGREFDELERVFNSGSSGGFFQMSLQVTRPPTPVRPSEPSDSSPIFHFVCCNERIKHDGKESKLACIICGVQKDVERA